MKEYIIENGHDIDLKKLEAKFMDKDSYITAHKGMVIACHDAFVQYENGILLVRRKDFPAKGLLWPVGGRLLRGIPTEESMRMKVEEECGLQLENMIELGYARVFLETEPFGHGAGTDSTAIVYFGRGKGKIKLNHLHEEPTIVTPEQYASKYRSTLHPYVVDYMDKAIPLVNTK